MKRVSIGGLAVASAGAIAAVTSVASCGYRPVYGGVFPERFHVVLFRTLVPDVVASDEVVAGCREELARSGALAPGDGYPRVEIEVLRVDDSSEGIAVSGGRSPGPVARATDVGIVARAWVVQVPGAEPEGDTGDLSADVTIAVDEVDGTRMPDPRASAFHQPDALRAAARRLGRTLATKVTAEPTWESEPRTGGDRREGGEEP